jgi:hypothetical protein
MEELSLLSTENRTLKVSPSLTIELLDDDDDQPTSPRVNTVNDDVDPFQVPLPPSPRSPRVVELTDDDEAPRYFSGSQRAGMTDD